MVDVLYGACLVVEVYPFFIEYFRRTVHDPVLCKLLNNAVHDDLNHTHGFKLQEYITDGDNYRSIVKCGQSLWDALLQLFTMEGWVYNFVYRVAVLLLSLLWGSCLL